MTRLFGNRNNKTTIAELEEYYSNQNQKKTRNFKAWLMMLLSILITIAVILALFFFGRWVFNTFIGDSNDSASTTTSTSTSDESNIDLPTFDGDIVGQGNTSEDSSDSNSSNSTSTDNGGVVTDEAASTTDSNADRVAGASTDSSSSDDSTATPSTGGEETIPNTGADDILIFAPISAAIIGYIISRKRQLSK